MNQQTFKSKWKQIRGPLKDGWDKLTDADLDRVAGDVDQFISLLQEKYDYTRQHGEQELELRLAVLREQRLEEEFRRRMAKITARQKSHIPPPILSDDELQGEITLT